MELYLLTWMKQNAVALKQRKVIEGGRSVYCLMLKYEIRKLAGYAYVFQNDMHLETRFTVFIV